jgi:hypothetical protein
MIKVWDFDFNQVAGKEMANYDDHHAIQRAFDFNLDLMTSLERRGFEGVFYSCDEPLPEPLSCLACSKDRTYEDRRDGQCFAVPPTLAACRRTQYAGLFN